MIRNIKIIITKFLKNIFGENIFILYHKFLAHTAAFYYRYPSKKMLVIAVTGTKGKTSTLNFLWHVLTAGGYKVGMISTANIKIGDEELMNWYHMTMPGRFLLQKLLKKIYDGGCDIALVEATSEGIKNGRHIGLYYDVAIYTNLFPEHLASHGGSFEKYKQTKGILFENLSELPKKIWKSKQNNKNIEKLIIANADTEFSDYYLSFKTDKKISYGLEWGEYRAINTLQTQKGVEFNLNNVKYEIPLIGIFNIYNALPAIAMADYLGISTVHIVKGLANCAVIPGRMEMIDVGQNFTAIVDYAHEEFSMGLAVESAIRAKKSSNNKIIVIFGGDGGGREPRTNVVKLLAEKSDISIVTLSDPFDTDPQEINDFLMSKFKEYGIEKNSGKVFDYIDRRLAIEKAVSLAEEGDVLLFTCKGAEQTIIFKNRIIPWDDRLEVRKAILNRIKDTRS